MVEKVDLTDKLKKEINDLISKNRVVLFMKGDKNFPRCGFSKNIVEILNHIDVPYVDIDVLDKYQYLREAVKEFSLWPTYPQLYIDGNLIGGSDIVMQMYYDGSLLKLLQH